MKSRLSLGVLIALIGFVYGFARPAAAPMDISGTWIFSVDLESGGHGDPTFEFKQDKENLSGSYDGPLGQYKVTGTIKENKAVFGFEFSRDGESHKATYTATVESASKMSGTLVITNGPTGKWTATKK
ncbi:MAG TPA: hypothetical protein VFB82_19845 [Blastocatellia bacterium]|jgi:hypothetical protein|nr:hypothetical protein [Blastocatellia bacterium]